MTQTASNRRSGNAARSVAAISSAAIAKLRVWHTRIRSHAFWVNLTSPRTIWHGMIFIFGWVYALFRKLPFVIAILVIGTIIYEGLTQHATVINPISVSKDLAERGYTPDIAGQRLRDAMTTYVDRVHARKSNPQIALHGDLPNLVVPTVGISLDAVVSSFRTLMRSTRSRTISGEITARENHLWLRLRLDGKEIYVSSTGAELEKPDDLFAAAVQAVLTKISPYYVAMTLLQNHDLNGATAFVDDMIGKLSAKDEDLPWLYNVRGLIYIERNDYAAATKALEKAIHLNWYIMIAHNNLGLIHWNQNRRDLAADEYRNAIKIDPNFAVAHSNLGVYYKNHGDDDAAKAEYLRALEIEPDSPLAHNNYGSLLHKQQKYAEAEIEINKALAANKNYAVAHTSLAEVFRDTGRRDAAIAEFTEALRLSPHLTIAQQELDKLQAAPTATGSVQQK